MDRINLPLSRDRLWTSLMDLARIGALPNGGNDRQTLTDRDAEGAPCSSAGARPWG